MRMSIVFSDTIFKLLEDIGPDLSNVDGSWPVIGQFSSIGSLGVDESKWLCREWLQSLSSGRKKLNRDKSNVPSLKLVCSFYGLVLF